MDRATEVAIGRIVEFDVDAAGSEHGLAQLASDAEHVARELQKVHKQQRERKTVVVCHRLLPTGDKDTAVRVVSEETTIGDLNAWSDKLCAGHTVCLRLELVDQYRG